MSNQSTPENTPEFPEIIEVKTKQAIRELTGEVSDRAQAARALGQRTTSANARGFYVSEALLHEGKLRFGENAISHYQQLSQALGAV